jgi:hypothetical protein
MDRIPHRCYDMARKSRLQVNLRRDQGNGSRIYVDYNL